MTDREDAIVACCQAGLSVNQTARELRLTPGQVTAVRKRLSLTFAKGQPCEANLPADYRSAIADMRPLEAVEYLSHLLDQLLWHGLEHGLEPIAGCRMTYKQAQLTYFLHHCPGRSVAPEQIMHALYSDRAAGDMPTLTTLNVFASKVRAKLAPHATIRRDQLGLSLHLAPGVSLDWTRGIKAAPHQRAKQASREGA